MPYTGWQKPSRLGLPQDRPGRSPKLAAFDPQIDPLDRFAGFAVGSHP